MVSSLENAMRRIMLVSYAGKWFGLSYLLDKSDAVF